MTPPPDRDAADGLPPGKSRLNLVSRAKTGRRSITSPNRMIVAPPTRLSSVRQVSSHDPGALAPAPSVMKTAENPGTKQALSPKALSPKALRRARSPQRHQCGASVNGIHPMGHSGSAPRSHHELRGDVLVSLWGPRWSLGPSSASSGPSCRSCRHCWPPAALWLAGVRRVAEACSVGLFFQVSAVWRFGRASGHLTKVLRKAAMAGSFQRAGPISRASSRPSASTIIVVGRPMMRRLV